MLFVTDTGGTEVNNDDMWYKGIKSHHMKVLAFLFNHIIHCICFKMLLTGSKYLVSNRGYTRLIRTIKKVKKLNRKKFKIFHVITILCNHHFILLKLIWAIKSFILYQKDQMELKLGYNFTTCDGFWAIASHMYSCMYACMPWNPCT